MKYLFSLICCLITLTALRAQDGTINLKKGQKYSLQSTMNTVSNTEMMGQSIETTADVTSLYTLEVSGTENSKYQFTNTLKQITMKVDAMGQDMSFNSDSASDMNGEMGQPFKDLINKPKKVEMDKSGTITQVEKSDTSDNTAESPSAYAMEQMLGDMSQNGYGAKIAFQSLPKNAKVGYTWSDSSSDNGISRNTKYTVKSISGDMATVQLEGTMSTDMKTEMQGMEVLTKTTGTFTGEQLMDIKKGILKKSTVDTDTKGTVTVMGQEVPNNSKVKVVTEVKEL